MAKAHCWQCKEAKKYLKPDNNDLKFIDSASWLNSNKKLNTYIWDILYILTHYLMKWFVAVFIFLLPFHAIAITYLKCKMWIDTDILRFWKEIVVVFLLGMTLIQITKQYHGKFRKVLENNSLLGVTLAFIICSFVFIFFPLFDIHISSILGFKYDVFFFFCLIIGLYLNVIHEHFELTLQAVFSSIGVMLIIFLPWFVFGNIESSTDLLGFSKTPSTYEANSCISFSQNVTGGHHRFQWSFWDPIRGSVFLVVFFFIYLGYALQKFDTRKKLLLGVGLPTLVVVLAIFLSLTKTSMLGFLFGCVAFGYITITVHFQKKIPPIYYSITAWGLAFMLFLILYVKRALFLHPEAILGRVNNLVDSLDMFWHNPIGFWLGIAWPASQLATSTDTTLSDWVQKFLPENWYVQILLEQWIIWISLFLSVIIMLIVTLWKITKHKRDFLSIGIFVSFITILFMANFTHIFEESATSYTLYLIIGAYITKEVASVHNRQRKKHKKA